MQFTNLESVEATPWISFGFCMWSGGGRRDIMKSNECTTHYSSLAILFLNSTNPNLPVFQFEGFCGAYRQNSNTL